MHQTESHVPAMAGHRFRSHRLARSASSISLSLKAFLVAATVSTSTLPSAHGQASYGPSSVPSTADISAGRVGNVDAFGDKLPARSSLAPTPTPTSTPTSPTTTTPTSTTVANYAALRASKRIITRANPSPVGQFGQCKSAQGLRLAQNAPTNVTETLPSPAGVNDSSTGANNRSPTTNRAKSDTPTSGSPEEPIKTGPHSIPLAGPPRTAVDIRQDADGLVSLIVRDATVKDILGVLAESQGVNIVCADDIQARLSISLDRVTLEDALDVVLAVAGYTWTKAKGIIIVTSVNSNATLPAEIQGRRLEVFELNFVTAEDVLVAVQGMLSPVGAASSLVSSNANNRQTKEVVVVEDLPNNLERIRQYIGQVDLAPRQVFIEAHVLSVDLKNGLRHGVNFEHMFSPSSTLVNFRTKGLANPTSSQAFFFELSGGNLASLVEALRTTSDAKTLAQPRLQVLNGQTAKLQVGQQLGFRVTTTTQTSTTQGVQFLNVGVILEITPRISNDGRILLQVRPEVSSGRVNPDTGLPEQETTNLSTDVMLVDGQGIVIGGLIRETDTNVQNKLPILGDLKWIGPLFSRRELEKRRVEVIVTLLPRIAPFDPLYQQHLDVDDERSRTPLLQPCLERYPRPWEAQLPDPIDNPVTLRRPRARRTDGVPPSDSSLNQQSYCNAMPNDVGPSSVGPYARPYPGQPGGQNYSPMNGPSLPTPTLTAPPASGVNAPVDESIPVQQPTREIRVPPATETQDLGMALPPFRPLDHKNRIERPIDARVDGVAARTATSANRLPTPKSALSTRQVQSTRSSNSAAKALPPPRYDAPEPPQPRRLSAPGRGPNEIMLR